jgi:hypothetical protein
VLAETAKISPEAHMIPIAGPNLPCASEVTPLRCARHCGGFRRDSIRVARSRRLRPVALMERDYDEAERRMGPARNANTTTWVCADSWARSMTTPYRGTGMSG